MKRITVFSRIRFIVRQGVRVSGCILAGFCVIGSINCRAGLLLVAVHFSFGSMPTDTVILFRGLCVIRFSAVVQVNLL